MLDFLHPFRSVTYPAWINFNGFVSGFDNEDDGESRSGRMESEGAVVVKHIGSGAVRALVANTHSDTCDAVTGGPLDRAAIIHNFFSHLKLPKIILSLDILILLRNLRGHLELWCRISLRQFSR